MITYEPRSVKYGFVKSSDKKRPVAVYFVRKYTAAKFALRRAKLGFAQLNLLRKLNSALPS